jgi:hypothetical protein
VSGSAIMKMSTKLIFHPKFASNVAIDRVWYLYLSYLEISKTVKKIKIYCVPRGSSFDPIVSLRSYKKPILATFIFL